LHTGTPEGLFRRPHARFSKRAHAETGEGLCWAAVHACQGAYEGDSIRRFIFYAPDVTKEPSFVLPMKGHHHFKAILVAPIVHERSREVLGVVCLDSDSPDHYTEVDQHLVAIAALALSVAWKARQTAVK
jgi:GAF domain-containing protein